MASHYCRASDSIRLSGEKIIRAIHTHKGSVCLFWCVCVCVCAFYDKDRREKRTTYVDLVKLLQDAEHLNSDFDVIQS